MNKKMILLGAVVLSVVIGGGVYVKWVPPQVYTASPTRGSAVEAIYATGTVEPAIRIPLAPKSTARMTELLADEGQMVKKGDILARFEDEDLAAAISQIEAQLSYARKEVTRKETLVKKKFVSTEAYDKALSDLAVAEAALSEAEAKRNYQLLIAPEDATIIRRDGEAGTVIPANTPVFYLSGGAPNRISAEVDEEDIVHVRTGQKVLIQSDAFPDQSFEGKVKAITPMGDSESRSFRVRIDIPKDFPMLIGMTAETNIVTRESGEALLIPLTALGTKNKVQIVKDGIVKLVGVSVGAEGKDTVEITAGLSDNDRIIVPFRPQLEDGQAVRVEAGGQ